MKRYEVRLSSDPDSEDFVAVVYAVNVVTELMLTYFYYDVEETHSAAFDHRLFTFKETEY